MGVGFIDEVVGNEGINTVLVRLLSNFILEAIYTQSLDYILSSMK